MTDLIGFLILVILIVASSAWLFFSDKVIFIFNPSYNGYLVDRKSDR